MNKVKWIILVAITIVLIVVFIGKDKKDDTDETLVQEENAVLVIDQAPGEETIVSYAKLSKPGYVTVYSTNEAGEKTLLGTSGLLTAGEHKNVVVKHKSGSSVNKSKISAVVVADDGDGLYGESDTETLVETSGDENMAEISDEAVLDLELSEDELGDLLEDAGYTTDDDSNENNESEVEDNSSEIDEANILETMEVGVEADSGTKIEVQ